MSTLYWVCALVAAVLFVYLLVGMFRAEEF
jgi:K+-transporting ATPase KdpF subunit